eukprot:jgi/Tetstr1/436765/TSEL_025545.t1
MADSTKMAITAALALCTTVALRINKRGKKLHVEHEYGAEVAREFDAVDPLGEKGSADNKELKKAIEKVKAKKPSSSSSRAKPTSSSRKPESSRRGSDNRREGGRPKRTLGLAVKNAKERLACDLRVLRWEDVSFLPTYLEFRFVKRKHNQHRLCGKVRVAKMPGAVVCVYGLLRRRYLARWLSPLLTPALTEAAFLTRFGAQSSRSGGASAAANADIPFATWGQHSGWKSTSARLRYMGLDEEHILSVSRAILTLAEED